VIIEPPSAIDLFDLPLKLGQYHGNSKEALPRRCHGCGTGIPAAVFRLDA